MTSLPAPACPGPCPGCPRYPHAQRLLLGARQEAGALPSCPEELGPGRLRVKDLGMTFPAFLSF